MGQTPDQQVLTVTVPACLLQWSVCLLYWPAVFFLQWYVCLLQWLLCSLYWFAVCLLQWPASCLLCSRPDLEVHGDGGSSPFLIVGWQQLDLCTDLRLLHTGHSLYPTTQRQSENTWWWVRRGSEDVEVTCWCNTDVFSWCSSSKRWRWCWCCTDGLLLRLKYWSAQTETLASHTAQRQNQRKLTSQSNFTSMSTFITWGTAIKTVN